MRGEKAWEKGNPHMCEQLSSHGQAHAAHVWGKDMWVKGNLYMRDPPMHEESPHTSPHSKFGYESPFRTMKCVKYSVGD